MADGDTKKTGGIKFLAWLMYAYAIDNADWDDWEEKLEEAHRAMTVLASPSGGGSSTCTGTTIDKALLLASEEIASKKARLLGELNDQLTKMLEGVKRAGR